MKTLLLPVLAWTLASAHGVEPAKLTVEGEAFEAIPEPATAAQLLGLMALCLIVRRRPH